MNTANMRNFQRKRFVSTPNDFVSGGLHHARQFSPAVAVDSTFTNSSPSSSRRGSEAVENSFGNGKESTLAALTVVSKANQRRRRRMSATAEQLQAEKAMMASKGHKKYFHKVGPMKTINCGNSFFRFGRVWGKANKNKQLCRK